MDFFLAVQLHFTIGHFLYFYRYCADKYRANKQLMDNFFLMLAVKAIRNAAAHNNCIINDLLGHSADIGKLNHAMLRSLSDCIKSRQTRDTQLSKIRMQQIITLFYAHKVIVTSAGVHEHIAETLNGLADRLFKKHDYAACESLQKSLAFIRSVVDFWYKTV